MGGLDLLTRALDESGPSGLMSVANRLLSSPEYADHDSLYGWLDFAYADEDNAVALESLRTGLERCPRKTGLLHKLGVRMAKMGLAADAVYYWAQSVHSNELSLNAPNSDVYRCLAHVSATYGDDPVPDWFIARATTYDAPQEFELSADMAATITALFDRADPAMGKVVRLLYERYG